MLPFSPEKMAHPICEVFPYKKSQGVLVFFFEKMRTDFAAQLESAVNRTQREMWLRIQSRHNDSLCEESEEKQQVLLAWIRQLRREYELFVLEKSDFLCQLAKWERCNSSELEIATQVADYCADPSRWNSSLCATLRPPLLRWLHLPSENELLLKFDYQHPPMMAGNMDIMTADMYLTPQQHVAIVIARALKKRALHERPLEMAVLPACGR